MIIFGVYAFAAPYENLAINIVECLSCTILIFIVLLRNTRIILEELLVLAADSKENIVDGSCSSDSSGAICYCIKFFMEMPLVSYQ